MATPGRGGSAGGRAVYIPPSKRAALLKESQEKDQSQRTIPDNLPEQVAHPSPRQQQSADRYSEGIPEENGRWKKTLLSDDSSDDNGRRIDNGTRSGKTIDRHVHTPQRSSNGRRGGWRQSSRGQTPRQESNSPEPLSPTAIASTDQCTHDTRTENDDAADALEKQLSALAVSQTADLSTPADARRSPTPKVTGPWATPNNRIRQPPPGQQLPQHRNKQQSPFPATPQRESPRTLSDGTPRRPKTTDVVARRLIAGALGIRLPKKPAEKAEADDRKLRDARAIQEQQKRQPKDRADEPTQNSPDHREKQSAWDE